MTATRIRVPSAAMAGGGDGGDELLADLGRDAIEQAVGPRLVESVGGRTRR